MPLLTPAERQVLLLLMVGYSKGEIAVELNLPEPLIRSTTKQICVRLGARNTAQAAALALGTGEVTLDEVRAEAADRGRPLYE
jgi:DNA-binding CsgD family transcriptional regulator